MQSVTIDPRVKAQFAQCARDEDNPSQLKNFRSPSLRQRLASIERMADLVRHFQKVCANGGFRTVSPEPPAKIPASAPEASD